MVFRYIIFMKTYTVYRLENIVTKKNYIGMTGDAPRKRWGYGYVGKMGDALNNYPLDLCWKKHIELQTPNKEQALELESELMKWYDSVENGYNTSIFNGHSCNHTNVAKKKIAESRGVDGVIQYSKSGEFIAEYYSLKEASRQTGCNLGHICSCCRGERKSTGGYLWKYKNGGLN